MDTASGIVKQIEQRDGRNGDPYVLVRLEGWGDTGLFDWEGLFTKAGIEVGDGVSLMYEPGEFPRVKSAEKLDPDAVEATPPPATDRSLSTRDSRIARQVCLKSAACLLQGADVPADERATAVIQVAAQFEEWVLR